MENIPKIDSFNTNSGVLFLFQIDKYKPIYITSDINALTDDILNVDDVDSELYDGRKFNWDGVNYEIIRITGYKNSQLLPDVPDMHRGTVYNYSYVMVLSVKII